jgi:hypothetical protein
VTRRNAGTAARIAALLAEWNNRNFDIFFMVAVYKIFIMQKPLFLLPGKMIISLVANHLTPLTITQKNPMLVNNLTNTEHLCINFSSYKLQ